MEEESTQKCMTMQVDIYSEANDGMIYYEHHYCWRVNAAILAAVGSIVLIESGAGAPAGVAGLGALVLA